MRTRTPLSEPEILFALRICRGDVEAAASLLGISPRTLYRRMAEYGIRAQVRYEPVKEEA